MNVGLLSRSLRAIARHPDMAAAIAFAALALAFCARFLVGGVLLPADALYLTPPWRDAPGAPVVASVHNELIADLIVQNYSWKQFIADSYRHGHFPLWNPYLFAGTPFLAAGQYAALYPFGALFIVLPVAVAYGWFAALHLWLAGVFTYLYLRIIGVARMGAFVGAVAFQFAGFLVVSFVWPMILSAAVWLPLGLAMCELVARHLERGTWNAKGVGLTPAARLVVPVGAIAVGMQLLAGHLEISFYFLFTLMTYSAFRLIWALARGRKLIPTIRAGFGLLMLVGLGFAVAAAQLLPFFELIRENYRIGQVTFAEVQGWALPVTHLLAYLIPDIFGNPTHHSIFNLVTGQWEPVVNSRDTFGNVRDYPFWGAKNYVEGAVYVGVAPLILAAVAIWRVRSKYVAFFAGYLVFCLLLAFGTPLYLLIWRIPGVDQLHTPFRWAYPAAFCLVALAGIGAGHLITNARRVVTWTREQTEPTTLAKLVVDPAPRRLAIACLATSAVILTALVASRVTIEPTLALVEAVRARSTMLSLAFPDAVTLYSYQAARVAAFAGVVALTGGAFAAMAWRPRVGGIALAAVVVIDLFATYYPFNTSSTTDLVAFTPPSIAAIKADTSLFRVTSFNYDDTLRPNTNMLFGLQDIRGYDTVILKDYVKYWSLLEEPSGLLYSMINKLVDARSLQSPLLDLLNVKYVLTTQNIGLPGWTDVYRGEINVYRNERVLPRAFVVGEAIVVDSADDARTVIGGATFDPRRVVVLEREHGASALRDGAPFAAAEIRRYEPGRVEIRVDVAAPAYVVLADTYFPGWKAQIN
ncbi:MAG: hypothetical protein NZ518_01420, partial [Dehalococcoidia bacterium]|nr:hypothetical protein [Dehalococcoidia bacterium]